MTDIIKTIAVQNPWHRSGKLDLPPLLSRDIFARIKKLEEREEIVTVLGPRQVGKTTLFYQLIADLLVRKVTPERILYFNFDSLALRNFCRTPADLISFLQAKNNGRMFLFFDEAQRLKDAGIFLKEIKDNISLKAKIYVSGSSSLLLRAKTKEYLTGRQISFILLPFSWQEYQKAKGMEVEPASHNLTDLKEYQRIYGESLENLFWEFLVWGGYPKIVTTESVEEKELLLTNLVSDYLEKDISSFLRLDSVVFNKLLALVSYQIGNIINKEELSRTASASLPTINKYLKILEETFVVKLIPPYFRNRRKEISHNPKIYFYDLGLRNKLVSQFQQLEYRGDKGFIVENFVCTEIVKEKLESNLHFWRSRAGAEVDFVFDSGQEVTPLEVKYQEMKKEEMPKSFINFLKLYRPRRAFIITKNFLGEKRFDKTDIYYLPAYLLLQAFGLLR